MDDRERLVDTSENSYHRKKYVEGVKRALNDALDEAAKKEKLTKKELLEKLQETYGFKLTKQTLNNLFSFKNNSLDYACLVTVCRFFGFDFNKILAPKPIKGAKEEFRRYASSDLRAADCPDFNGADSGTYADVPFVDCMSDVKDKFLVLNDTDYMGVFYGYTAPTDGAKTTPNMFTLTIEPDSDTGVVSATLTTEKAYEDSDKKGKSKNTYHGIPVFVKRYLAVLLFMVNDNNSGGFVQLSFSYEEYPDELGLIYRHGILMTGESINGASLSTQSFLLFNKKVSSKNYKYMYGLLKAPNHNFNVPVKEAEKLAEKDEDVAEFLVKFKDVLERNKKEVYMINEDNILTDRASDMLKYNVVRALLLLKSKSKLANTYHYRARYRYTGFAVKCLAEAKLEVDEENDGDDE